MHIDDIHMFINHVIVSKNSTDNTIILVTAWVAIGHSKVNMPPLPCVEYHPSTLNQQMSRLLRILIVIRFSALWQVVLPAEWATPKKNMEP